MHVQGASQKKKTFDPLGAACRLTSLPTSLNEIPQDAVVDATGNTIVSLLWFRTSGVLHPFLAGLPLLRTLECVSCRLERLPSFMSQLTWLEVLTLRV